jgi:SAM-dependent methyltransferase
MSALDSILELPLVYHLWQAPFAEKKLAPLFANNDIRRIRRVLDVGCGPGTNTAHFAHADYLGIDLNPRYIARARQRHGREFVAADVTEHRLDASSRFDCILVNSLLHHLDDAGVSRLLRHLPELLTDDGFVHILDLVLPPGPSLSRSLALLDRGDHPRSIEMWRSIFEGHFEPIRFDPYALGLGSSTLWSMVYFKGKARRG